MREGRTIAIPKASTIAHVEENAAAAALELTSRHLEVIDPAFPTCAGNTVGNVMGANPKVRETHLSQLTTTFREH
ncbi:MULTISPECIES: hypothetical protein [Micrococcaceae]|uniref:hypothetical protein n=1 Tax=unclassified Arthrobacter TaxID=235627 RepID=UPI00336BC8CF